MEEIRRARVVASVQSGVITADQCRAIGVTDGMLRRLSRDRRWLRLSRAVYLVDADVFEGVPPRAALIRAAMLSTGPHAVAVLETAAELLGVAGFRTTPTVHLSLPGTNARPRRYTEADLRLHQFVLPSEQITVVNGFRVTTAARTVADIMLRSSRLTAVALLDSGLNRRLLTDDDLDLVRGLMAGRRGSVAAIPWTWEADGRADSPLETRVRLRAVDGNLPPDELQYRVRDRSGRVVAITDFAWLHGRNRIVGEADGSDAHDNPTAVFRDRRRQNDIIAADFVPIRFTWADTVNPATVPRTVLAALHRGRAA